MRGLPAPRRSFWFDSVEIEDVVERVQRGDASAFSELVRQTQQTLYRVAARILGSPSDAEDVLQEAYMKAHAAIVDGRFSGANKLEKVDGNEEAAPKARVTTWLYRIVVNQALDHLRSKKRRRTEELDDEMPLNAASAEQHVALRELKDLLGTLSEQERVAFVLKELEGRTSREIAEMLDTTEGAVEQRLVRARATLREKMS